MEDKKKRFKGLTEIERSIIKTYRKPLWGKFVKALNEFNLIEDGDKIAVAISGGKDSLIMAKLFQEIYKHGNRNFELEFIAMDPGYTKEVREVLESNCEYLNIPLKVFDSNVFEVANHLSGDNPCYMCARMRRGFLYSKAEELGCNKLSLGHHFDDVIETTLLNVLCSANYKTMLPKLKSDNFENMEIIRPLYFINEEDIIRFTKFTGLEPLDCACTVSAGKTSSKRKDIKELIKSLEDDYHNVRISIFRSAQNVDLDGVLEWKDEMGETHSFLSKFEKEEI